MAVYPRHCCTAQKNLAEHVETQTKFLDTELKPKLDAAQAGKGLETLLTLSFQQFKDVSLMAA
jgi:hypothetical protein